MSEQTATDRLRELLDERGVEWTANDGEYIKETCWTYMGELTAAFAEYNDGTTRFDCDTWCFTPEQATEATMGPQITEDTSDGWHSFKDLYHHRALLFSVIVHNYRDMCWKSKRHHDGKELDWNFIVGIDTPWGQASYHYGMEYWDLFDCKVLDKAPYYDGYTADESVSRIAKLVELDTATVGAKTCKIDFDYEASQQCQGPIYRCDSCGVLIKDIETSEGKFKYCPNCGRRIEVSE